MPAHRVVECSAVFLASIATLWHAAGLEPSRAPPAHATEENAGTCPSPPWVPPFPRANTSSPGDGEKRGAPDPDPDPGPSSGAAGKYADYFDAKEWSKWFGSVLGTTLGYMLYQAFTMLFAVLQVLGERIFGEWWAKMVWVTVGIA